MLTPACVLLGYQTAAVLGDPDPLTGLLVLLGALFAHVSVNALNEYSDFRSGLDLRTTKTPFNGGSGALPAHPEAAKVVLAAGVAGLTVTVFAGVWIVFRSGAAVVPLGLAGIALVVAYTDWITRHPYLCLLAPGLGFGPLMVVGTHVSLTGQYAALPLLASLVPLFLVSNLLLLNQYPDLEADRSVGRRHFPIAYGLTISSRVYAGFACLAGIVLITGVVLGVFPTSSAVALLPLGATFWIYRGARRSGRDVSQLYPYLAANVASTVITIVVFGLSLRQ